MTFLQRRTSTVLTQKLKPTEGVIIKDVNQIALYCLIPSDASY